MRAGATIRTAGANHKLRAVAQAANRAEARVPSANRRRGAEDPYMVGGRARSPLSRSASSTS